MIYLRSKDLGIFKIYQDSTIFPFSSNTIEIEDCVGPTKNEFSMWVPPGFPQFSKYWISKMMRDVNIICCKMRRDFSCIRLSILVMNNGFECSHLMNNENSENDNNIGICPQALTSHFKQIIKNRNSKIP